MRVAIVAALPGELKWLVKSWLRVPGATRWVHRHGDDEWVAVCAGMGAEAARRAFAEAESEGTIDRVLSVGWAGALNDDEVRPAKSFMASAVIDAQTGERFELGGGERKLVLVSTARVADETEKRRLAAAYGGAMVDMESAAIVRLALMRGIPVCCVKAISDEAGARLPDFNRFIDARGQMRMAAFVGYLAVRPQYWGALARLGRTSSAAARSLAAAVITILTGTMDWYR